MKPATRTHRSAFSCPVAQLLDTLGKRWILLILHHISGGVRGFNALKKELGAVSSRTLSERLTELESSGFIERRVTSMRPIKIEYRLTPRGEKVETALAHLASLV